MYILIIAFYHLGNKYEGNLKQLSYNFEAESECPSAHSHFAACPGCVSFCSKVIMCHVITTDSTKEFGIIYSETGNAASCFNTTIMVSILNIRRYFYLTMLVSLNLNPTIYVNSMLDLEIPNLPAEIPNSIQLILCSLQFKSLRSLV